MQNKQDHAVLLVTDQQFIFLVILHLQLKELLTERKLSARLRVIAITTTRMSISTQEIKGVKSDESVKQIVVT